jgi:hypothetical protein
LLGALLLLIVLIACVLSLGSMFIREIYLWGRIAIPATIFVRVIGSVQRTRLPSTVSAVVAWVGISCFLISVIGTIAPDESIRLTDNPVGSPSVVFLAIRFVLLITIGIGDRCSF